MIKKCDVEPLTGFIRDVPKRLHKMKQTGRPLILTVKGKKEYVIQDAASYQKLMQFMDELDQLDLLRQSIKQADQGKTVPLRAAVERLGKK
jgi:PHD/YefM family antitoxin component YafN of YafNO toxin-antitoxin module